MNKDMIEAGTIDMIGWCGDCRHTTDDRDYNSNMTDTVKPIVNIEAEILKGI